MFRLVKFEAKLLENGWAFEWINMIWGQCGYSNLVERA